MDPVTVLDRRDFVRLTSLAGTGLIVGVWLPGGDAPAATTAEPLQPNAFLRVDPDGSVTIWLGRADMGQGVRTALPMIVAEELDADWKRVTVLQGDAHPTAFGRMMTVGSSSVRNGAWNQLRIAGASARPLPPGSDTVT